MKEKRKITVRGKVIGGESIFIVAEIGSNHNRNLQCAFDTIEAAIGSGADAVKFQSLNLDELYYSPSENIKKLHEKIDMDENWHYELKSFCDKKNTIFLSSPTYLKAVEILEQIDVPAYKLASAQIGTFPQIIERVAQTKKPVLLSTGLITYDELGEVINIFKKYKNDNFVIMHCGSMYPTPYAKANIGLINEYKSRFGEPVGFSDHSLDIYLPLAAAGMGVKVIEKHFTLDRRIDTPDVSISLNPEEFRKMVDGIRATEQAMAFKHRTKIESQEEKFKEAIIYRLVLKRNKKKGAKFFPEDFDFKRYNEGIDCRDMEHIIDDGVVAKGNYGKGTLLKWDMLEK